MSNVIGGIIIIMLVANFWIFYKSLTRRKNADEVYIRQLKTDKFELQKKCDKLQADLDHIRDHKVEKILNHKNKKHFLTLEKKEV